MGPDRLHPRVLKETTRAVAPILQIMFSKSLENGEVPDDWKQANIAPIFKKGERYCPSNYRPVSLTCACSKLMEHIISKHLLNHLQANNILFDKQHGFRKKSINRYTVASLHTRYPGQSKQRKANWCNYYGFRQSV